MRARGLQSEALKQTGWKSNPMVYGLGFRVQGLGFMIITGLGFAVYAVGFRVYDLRFRVWVWGFGTG